MDNKKVIIAGLAVIVLAAVGIFAFSGGSTNSKNGTISHDQEGVTGDTIEQGSIDEVTEGIVEESDSEPTQEATTQTPTPAPAPKTVSLSINIFDGSFSSKSISLKKGTTYKITVTNKGMNDHSLTSSLIDTGKLAPGQSKTITVTPKSTGTFAFKCNVPCPPYHSKMQNGYSFVVS